MSVRVSIILPSLNVADYIEETLESVKRQSLYDIEIICIDAGSVDGTWEIIKKCSYGDKRFRLLHSPIKSYGHQVNMGLEIAQGDYVAILETDDYVTSGMYETLYKNAIKWNVDYVKCDYSAFYMDKENNRRLISRVITTNDKYYETPFCPGNESCAAIDDWYLWNGIYKRSFIINKGITLSETPGAAFQDIGFLHQVLSFAEKAIYIKDDLHRYRLDRDEASSNSNKTLFYIRQEYGCLFDKQKNEKNNSKLLYKRMAKSYVRACMDSSDNVLNSQDGRDICEWFNEKLIYAQDNNIVKIEDIPFSMRRIYTKLLESVVEYIDYRNNRLDELKLFLNNSADIIIFGCGAYGMEAYNNIIKRGFKIKAFMDNNNALWGKRIQGINVINPQEVCKLPDDVGYIIANEKYSGDIERQLRFMKKQINIFIY